MMKKSCITWMIPALAIVMSGCDNRVGTGPEPVVGEGNIQFEYAVSDRVSSPRIGQRSLPVEALPDTESISMTITGGPEEQDPVSLYYETMAEYDTPLLKEGDYQASFRYGDPETEGDGKACFAGQTDFTIVARTTTAKEVSLALANSVFSLKTTEWFRSYYTEYTLTLRTESGFVQTYSGSAENPLESTEPLFVKSDNKIYFSGSAIKTNGKEVEFPTTEICTTKPQTWHTIDIDAGEASEGKIHVTLDESMIKISESEIELNPES